MVFVYVVFVLVWFKMFLSGWLIVFVVVQGYFRVGFELV
jgi:hypothetical protein